MLQEKSCVSGRVDVVCTASVCVDSAGPSFRSFINLAVAIIPKNHPPYRGGFPSELCNQPMTTLKLTVFDYGPAGEQSHDKEGLPQWPLRFTIRAARSRVYLQRLSATRTKEAIPLLGGDFPLNELDEHLFPDANKHEQTDTYRYTTSIDITH